MTINGRTKKEHDWDTELSFWGGYVYLDWSTRSGRGKSVGRFKTALKLDEKAALVSMV